ncbi:MULTISPECIES: glycosyltransferase family 2 protein [unclassified Achromobacter]|uniref:glycosyltransferase family 2 protein n=1 Tax=unclassified Achromobacter TaxID=2626865 RepID=UPI000B519FF1|nr:MULTISPECIES: glycosyltransferase family 2 protein [unclassified Achromobacter]OWT74944.1 glycosyl transferase [Achromobacter sp. HZ28]OWT76552.1 glycosyl transferase [Achromobacter sp. HZ34]
MIKLADSPPGENVSGSDRTESVEEFVLTPALSVVTTMYKSAPYLETFYERIVAEVEKLGVSHEIIFVNDGSPDNSLDVVLNIQKSDSRVIVIDLSRNFGHHKAIMEGLSYARGEKVFLIDCDLEEPPETLGEFYKRFSESDCDVVYGVQESRKGGWFERLSGGVFYKLFNYLSDITVPENWTIARLMSARYVASLVQFKEETMFLGGIMTAVGYRQIPLVMQKLHKGTTTYTLKRKLSALTSAVTSFSEKPLKFVFYTGFLVAAVAFIYALWLIFQKFVFGIPVDGWTSLAVSIWLIGGLIMLCLGIIGIYVAKVFVQTKHRPVSVIRQIYEVND